MRYACGYRASYGAREVIHSHGFRRENSPKILPPPPGTATGSITRHCPPPVRGREEAAERPGGEEFYTAVDTGKGKRKILRKVGQGLAK